MVWESGELGLINYHVSPVYECRNKNASGTGEMAQGLLCTNETSVPIPSTCIQAAVTTVAGTLALKDRDDGDRQIPRLAGHSD